MANPNRTAYKIRIRQISSSFNSFTPYQLFLTGSLPVSEVLFSLQKKEKLPLAFCAVQPRSNLPKAISCEKNTIHRSQRKALKDPRQKRIFSAGLAKVSCRSTLFRSWISAKYLTIKVQKTTNRKKLSQPSLAHLLFGHVFCTETVSRPMLSACSIHEPPVLFCRKLNFSFSVCSLSCFPMIKSENRGRSFSLFLLSLRPLL